MLAMLYVAAGMMLAICAWGFWAKPGPLRQAAAQRDRAPGFGVAMFSIVLWGWPWILGGYVLMRLLSRGL